MEYVIPELLGIKNTGMLDRACIASNGTLSSTFDYLQDYLDDKGRSAWPGHIYNA